MSSDLF
jgi:serine/threonine protein kinase